LLLLAVSAWSGGVAGAQSSTPETSTPKGDNDQGDNDQGDNDQGGTTAENGGTLYSLTNDPERNQVVAYRRAADGTLSFMARYDTGGEGTGFFENSDTMLLLGSSTGQSSPVRLGGGNDLLFAANPGSDDVSVFRVNDDGTLKLVDRTPTGEERPTSLTVRNGVLYAMNAAGDNLPGATFCFGGKPTITGFRVADSGNLTPIPGSTSRLSGGPDSGCTQVTFTPDGDELLVAQFGANRIDAFTVGRDGVARKSVANKPIGIGPFALNFDQRGRLLTTDDFLAKVGQGAVASYRVGDDDGRLTPIDGVVRNGETDPCWLVDTPDGKYVYVSNFGPAPFLTAPQSARRGTISSFRLNPDGSMTLLESQAAQVGVGSADITLAEGGRYLYALNTIEGNVKAYRVQDDGGLTRIDRAGKGLPAGEQVGGIASFDF
jgi:6-phosphogluconolactonase (cycloisomerase 2 family)